jgi:hypothetical protein
MFKYVYKHRFKTSLLLRGAANGCQSRIQGYSPLRLRCVIVNEYVLLRFIINHDHVTRLAIADPDCGAAAIKGCCRDWGAGRDT